MIERFRQTVETQHLLADHDRLVVGVSGGADSVCLLHLLLGLRDIRHLSLHVAHLDHQIRGLESLRDSEFVAQLAAQWGLPVTLGAADVRALAANEGIGLEEACRRARYQFLARTARETGAKKIVVGHHADDQAETLLMRLLRGAGLTGMSGMNPQAPCPYSDGELMLVRPLLSTSRAEIRAYCRDNNLVFQDDSSNLDPGFLRNRVRLRLLPLLDKASPGLASRLAQTADLLAADELALETCLQQRWPQLLVRRSDQTLMLDRAMWQELPLGLQRRAVRRAVRELLGAPLARDLAYRHVEDACRLAQNGRSGAQIDLPGRLVLAIRYRQLVFSTASSSPELIEYAGPLIDRTLPLAVSHEDVTIPDTAWTIRIERLPADSDLLARARSNPDPWQAFLDAQIAGAALSLRPRLTGEQIYPLGMGGHSVPLADYMSDRQIPAGLRNRLPLLCNANHLLWFVGWRIDERSCLTSDSLWVLHVTVQPSREV